MNKEELKQKMTNLVSELNEAEAILEDHVDELLVDWGKRNEPEVDDELEDEIDETREIIRDIAMLEDSIKTFYKI